jgi:uncharacterized protein (TIGR03435 family)
MARSIIVVLFTLTTVTPGAQSPSEFEAASIKRHPPNDLTVSMRSMPDGMTAVNLPMRVFVDDAYPTKSNRYVALPAWVDQERYDVAVRIPAGATREQVTGMWKRLLADRLKLAAHYDEIEEPTYDLVLARSDRRLGPQLKPSTIECTPPPAPSPGTRPPLLTPEEAMQRCAYLWAGNSIYSGGMTLATLADQLQMIAGRVVVDRTGLTGNYSLKLQYSPPTLSNDAAAPTSDTATIFTALREQLGLKLESATGKVQVVVVDHIERPSDN